LSDRAGPRGGDDRRPISLTRDAAWLRAGPESLDGGPPMTNRSLTGWLGPIGMGVLLAIVPASASGQAPPTRNTPPPSGDPPAARNRLGEEDAQQIEVLHQTIQQLRRAGMFAEAVKPARQAAEIVQKALDPGDWRVAEARRRMQDLERIAALPRDARDELLVA